MRCPIYHCTFTTATCLEYQNRAKGKSAVKKSNMVFIPSIEELKRKYKPCLTCSTGKLARKGKTEDKDVETLIAKRTDTEARKQKRCNVCKLEKPATQEYFNRNRTNRDGLAYACKECRSKEDREHYKRLKAKKEEDVDKMQNEAQSNIPAPIVDDKGKVVAWTDGIFVCRRCGREYTASEYEHLFFYAESDDWSERVCTMPNCQGNVKPGYVDEAQSKAPDHGSLPGLTFDEAYKKAFEIGITRTCDRCGFTGPETKFHQIGKHGRIDTCRKCVAKNRERNRIHNAIGQADLGPNIVVLDFSDYPEILERLRDAAPKNFRTLPNEIMYRLWMFDADR